MRKCVTISITVLCCLLFLACVLTGSLLYTLGYLDRVEDNLARDQTSCKINSISAFCSQCECDCIFVGKVLICDSCPCCGVHLHVTYQIGTGLMKQSSLLTGPYLKYPTGESAQNWAQSYFRLGTSVTCFYRRDDPTNLKWSLAESGSFKKGAISMLVIGIVSLCCTVIGVIIFIKNTVKPNS